MPRTSFPESPARALILAAGRGERMRPLTDVTPKPLLPVGGRPLIEWHLIALARAGVRNVVINTAWLEEQFPAVLGDGSRWGLRITYSQEGRRYGQALETAGGIATALEHLAPGGEEPFWLVSGDIHAPGFAFSAADVASFADSSHEAHLWMVDNPSFHPRGDFILEGSGLLHRLEAPGIEGSALTYANIGLLRPRLVQDVKAGERAALGPLLQSAAQRRRLSGQRWGGAWENVGTPGQWRALQSPVREG